MVGVANADGDIGGRPTVNPTLTVRIELFLSDAYFYGMYLFHLLEINVFETCKFYF